MGILSKSLSPLSSHAAKKTTLWEDITDRIEGCLYLSMVDEAEIWISSLVLRIPASWQEQIDELIEKKRAELADTDVGKILRDRFDF